MKKYQALSIIGLGVFLTLTPITSTFASHTNLSTYSFSTISTSWHRTTSDSISLHPLSVLVNFENDSVYNNSTLTFDQANFRANWSGIEFAIINTSGSYATFRYSAYFNFSFLSNNRLQIASTFYDSGSYSTQNNIIDLESTQYHSILMDASFLHDNMESKFNVRIGNLTTSISTPFTSGEWEDTDFSLGSTWNTAIRQYRNGSTLAVSTWTSTSELTNISYGDLSTIDDIYYTNLATWYYNLGQRQADSSTLIYGFSAMVGILVNFALMILNLSVLGVSLMDVFAVLFLFVGIIWTLKLIRG